jgi:hypothetical protein
MEQALGSQGLPCMTLKGIQNVPPHFRRQNWLPYTAETEDGARGCGTYELRPDDPSYSKIKKWLEAVERCEWSFFPFRPGDEIDQAEVDLFMRILPGLEMSTSQNRESRERGLQSIKESLFKLDGMALDMGRRIAFTKAYGGLFGCKSQSPEEGWDKVFDIWTRSTSVFRPNGTLRISAFTRRRSRSGSEEPKKPRKESSGQKASPTVSSARSKGASEL